MDTNVTENVNSIKVLLMIANVITFSIRIRSFHVNRTTMQKE